MKVLVINGSPKKDKSDTMHITRAFLDGMREAGEQEVRVIHAASAHVEYCTGCLKCMHNGGACVHDDDMRDILAAITSSDVVIWSFPLYCYGMPAPLKAVLDRTVSLSSMAMRKVGDRYRHVGLKDLSHQKTVMISGCGFPNSRHNFEGAVMQFRLAFSVESTIITIPESPMFSAPEAAAVTEPRLALVRQAGRQFAAGGHIEESMLAALTAPMIPEETYAAIVNSGV